MWINSVWIYTKLIKLNFSKISYNLADCCLNADRLQYFKTLELILKVRVNLEEFKENGKNSTKFTKIQREFRKDPSELKAVHKYKIN